jgi:hypothetical protein
MARCARIPGIFALDSNLKMLRRSGDTFAALERASIICHIKSLSKQKARPCNDSKLYFHLSLVLRLLLLLVAIAIVPNLTG